MIIRSGETLSSDWKNTVLVHIACYRVTYFKGHRFFYTVDPRGELLYLGKREWFSLDLGIGRASEVGQRRK